MNCLQHVDTAAVMTCSRCTAGICRECVEQGITLNEQPVCPGCAPQVLAENIRAVRGERRKAQICLALGGVLMFVGIIGALSGFVAGKADAGANAIICIIFFFGLAGLPSVWAGMRGSDADRAADRVLLQTGNGGGVLVGFIVKLLLGFAFGTIVAPLNALRNARTLAFTSTELRNSAALLAQYS